ncbi:DNA repair protein RecN [Moraxella sp. VT-16-12]|uniref:DNA repair protein RecN n=1 Tax=Moraxella sp. VT-16-12 TaxID=2014877 RepID=UPI000B7EB064|nr:DNA repair protein RecN [Moraxella sp. VT-16-12]TWV82462.1 DNA repair protein RecN [Moraxella sp. VT-16-12]
MLISLTLNNLALIDRHEVSFDGGFNVITGETGAGKSLILDALSLCVGERADAGLVRHGANEADVFGEFDVTDNAVVQAWFAQHEREFDDTLLIRRKVGANGRSKSWINGVPASISELKSLGHILVNIHSQHAGLALLKPQFVVDWLDSMGGLTTQKQATKDSHHHWQILKKQADETHAMSAQRADRMALLSSKLSDVEPLLGVDLDEIESEYDELSNLENLMQDAVSAVVALDNDDVPSVRNLLAKAMKICDNHADTSRVFDECSQALMIASEQIDDVISRLSDYAEQSLPDEARLDELNTLMGLSHRLAKKYQLLPNELSDEAKNWQDELDRLENMPDGDTLDKEVLQAYEQYVACANKLNTARQTAAPVVCQQLQQELVKLALPNAHCEFVFVKKPQEQYSTHGMYDISLLFSANVGMPAQPLHKVASGGELSRMALVMQVLVAGKENVACPTLVFDEVDVGISGATAQVVGELLRSLGAHQQLLAITHQAQVAAAAHRHLLVYKEHGEKTTSQISVLDDDTKLTELARMSGGVNITDATLAHVKSLVDDINKPKT